jgi:DNA polymerase III delta subunit
MVRALVGSNNYELKRRLDEVVQAFVKDNSELALERFDGEEAEAKSIVEAVDNLPFLSKNKLVVVRNGQLNKEFAEQIEQIISSTPQWCELVLYEPQIDRRSSYFKVLKAKSEFEDFAELNPQDLPKWLLNEASKHGGELSFADANYLVQRLGANQNRLSGELQKLITYSPKINRENIDLLTEPTPQSRVFDLLDAAFSEQKARALKLYDDQRAQRVEPQAILAMLVWQLNLIAIAKTGDGKSSAEMAKDSGSGEYPLRKAAGLGSKLTTKRLGELIDEVYEMELKSKTQTYDLDEALKTYITTI